MRTPITMGEPVKPKSSRRRRSMKRRYPCSRNPLAKITNRGGRVRAWVANRIRGCLPPRSGCGRSEEHTSELQSRGHLVCRLLLEKKKNNTKKLTEDEEA